MGILFPRRSSDLKHSWEDLNSTRWNLFQNCIHQTRTSKMLVPTGPQDPTVHLTQSFWMTVAPPIFVANKNWAHLSKPWEPSINPVLFLFLLHIIWRRWWLTIHFRQIFLFLRIRQFRPYFFGAPVVEVILELCKNIHLALCTSTILIPTYPQDPTVHLTQSIWMAVAPPIFVANNIWAHLVKPLEPSINPMQFFFDWSSS